MAPPESYIFSEMSEYERFDCTESEDLSSVAQSQLGSGNADAVFGDGKPKNAAENDVHS